MWTRRLIRHLATLTIEVSRENYLWLVGRLRAAQQRDLFDEVCIDRGGEG